MSKSYLIRWKSNVNGRAGKGTKLFAHAEAERLAQELNTEYPDIEHEAVLYSEPGGASAEAADQEPEAGAERPDNVHVLSFGQ
jgi:hypothetical protein